MSQVTNFTQNIKYLKPLIRPHYRSLALGFGLVVANSLSVAAIPYTLKLSVDALGGNGGYDFSFLIGVLVLLSIIHATLRVSARVTIYDIGRQVEHDLRNNYHYHLIHLADSFFQQQRVGDLVSRGSNDMTSVRLLMGPAFLQLSSTIITYATTFPLMLWLNPELTLLAIAPFPFVLLAAKWITQRLYRRSRRVAKQFGHLTTFIQESMTGISVVRNHGTEAEWNTRMKEETHKVFHSAIHYSNLQSFLSPLMMLTGGLGTLAILAYGGWLVAQRTLTVGDFVAFTGYLSILIWPTIGFGWILTVFQRGMAALERIGQVLDTPLPHYPTNSTQEKSFQPGHLRVSQLSFAAGKKNQLRNISLELQPGSFVGLVGRVGCGKTTLIQLLARLHSPQSGTLSLDGTPLDQFSEENFRQQVTMVPQESLLFSTTVAENILYGAPHQSDSYAEKMAGLTQLQEEVEQFPKGLHTIIGERGITLSGGQRQRVALARALATRPSLLLLDDPFSSVDPGTEGAILDQLHHWKERPTTLMVCHRVAALHQADTIFVMEEGELVAQGTHQELLKQNALYQDLHTQMDRSERLKEWL